MQKTSPRHHSFYSTLTPVGAGLLARLAERSSAISDRSIF